MYFTYNISYFFLECVLQYTIPPILLLTVLIISAMLSPVEMWWHTVTHGRGSEGGNWRMEWVASTLHTTSEHGVSSITTTDACTLAASSRLNWRPRQFKWTRLFCQKTKSGFCVCAITFQMHSTYWQHAETTNCTLHWSELSCTVVKGHYLLVLDVIMKSRV
jgi:hypothetical protein